MIITVTLNPALDKTISVGRLTINGINRVDSSRLDAGGKGINVSKVVKKLGGDTLAVGILGGESGMYIQHCLSELGVNNRFCFVDSPTRTNIKIVDLSMHTSTEVNERGEPVSASSLQDVFDILCEKVQPGDFVVFAGTAPPATPVDTVAKWSAEMIERGAQVFLDITGDTMKKAIAARPVLVTPNKDELEQIAGRRLYFDTDVIAEAKSLVYAGAERVIVTLGAEGAIYVTEDQVIHAKCSVPKVICQTGAGDTLMAAITYCRSIGKTWMESFRYGIAASSAHVMHPGTECGTEEEIDALLPNVKFDELM